MPEADLVAVPPEADDPSGKLPIGAAAWAFFEGARNPYVTLVTIYIFAPYVAAVFLVGERPGASVMSQEILSRWNTYSSILIMLTAPFLGASIDKLGRRKGWLGVVAASMVAISFTL